MPHGEDASSKLPLLRGSGALGSGSGSDSDDPEVGSDHWAGKSSHGADGSSSSPLGSSVAAGSADEGKGGFASEQAAKIWSAIFYAAASLTTVGITISLLPSPRPSCASS